MSESESKGRCCTERGCETAEGRSRDYPYIRDAEHLWPACTASRCILCDCRDCLWQTLQAVKRAEEEYRREREARYPYRETILLRCDDCGVSKSENPSLPPCDCIPF